jgi:heat-inducible transcriptional repressor
VLIWKTGYTCAAFADFAVIRANRGDLMQLGDRKKSILSAVVNLYIATGEPVGSKLLVNVSGLNLSSATLRKEMSELSEFGFLEQPHTSAGRVPSQMGYRTYVDCLMSSYELTAREKERIDELLKIEVADLESLLEKSGELLASLTGCAAVSAVQQIDDVQVRRIDILSASRRSMLLVLLTSSGVIKSRICRAADDLDPDMLAFFVRLLNEKIGGRAVNSVTQTLIDEIEGELYEYTFALKPVLGIVYDEIKGLSGSEVFLGGETNLLNNPGFNGDKALDLIRFLEKRDGLAMLVEDIREGVRVRIGNEIGPAFMQDSSLIAASYEVGGKPTGAIGIIGPTRMDYSRLMSHIAYFSSVLGSLISYTFSD